MNLVKSLLAVWLVVSVIWCLYVIFLFCVTGAMPLMHLILLIGNGTLIWLNARAWRSGLYND